MKAPTLTSRARAGSRDCANLAELNLEDLTRLTQDGPVLAPGVTLLNEAAFVSVAPEHLWNALSLHQCGRWGACDNWEVIENDEQLALSGSVVSRWRIEDTLEFTIETDLEPGEERTTVSLSPESDLLCDPPISMVRLGDVVLAETVNPVPYNRIWWALDQHRDGSPGDTDLFPRQSSFPPESVHISWWEGSGNNEFYCPPIWVLTVVSEPRLTSVFALASEVGSSTRH